jgi:hypothetical protein
MIDIASCSNHSTFSSWKVIKQIAREEGVRSMTHSLTLLSSSLIHSSLFDVIRWLQYWEMCCRHLFWIWSQVQCYSQYIHDSHLQRKRESEHFLLSTVAVLHSAIHFMRGQLLELHMLSVPHSQQAIHCYYTPSIAIIIHRSLPSLLASLPHPHILVLITALSICSVSCPIEIIKFQLRKESRHLLHTSMSTTHFSQPHDYITALRSVIRQHTILGLYKGFEVLLLKDTVGFGACLMCSLSLQSID